VRYTVAALCCQLHLSRAPAAGRHMFLLPACNQTACCSVCV
jgi:hypothetical protein